MTESEIRRDERRRLVSELAETLAQTPGKTVYLRDVVAWLKTERNR